MTNEKVVDPPASVTTPEPAVSRTPHIGLLLVVVLLAVVWWVFLSGLTITTANPVTFNRRQISESDRLVIATITKIDEDGTLELQVTEELLQSEFPITLKVLHNKLSLMVGKTYIFPLSRTLDLGYSVTRTTLPDKPPLVYPGDENAIKRLKQKLKEWRNSNKQR